MRRKKCKHLMFNVMHLSPTTALLPASGVAFGPWLDLGVDLSLVAGCCVLWVLWVPFANLFYVAGSAAGARLAGLRVANVDLGVGAVYAKAGPWLGVLVLVHYNPFFRQPVGVTATSLRCYQARHLFAVFSGVMLKLAAGLCMMTVVQQGIHKKGVAELFFSPAHASPTWIQVSALMILFDAVMEVLPLPFLQKRYGNLAGADVFRYLTMGPEAVRGEWHCGRAAEHRAEGRYRMAGYHCMRAWRFIADNLSVTAGAIAAGDIFEAGKTERACELLLRLARRRDVITVERCDLLDDAARYVLCDDAARAVRLDEALAWSRESLEFDNQRRDLRGTHGAICLAKRYLQDAGDNLSFALADKLDRHLSEEKIYLLAACRARVDVELGFWENAERRLSESTAPWRTSRVTRYADAIRAETLPLIEAARTRSAIAKAAAARAGDPPRGGGGGKKRKR
ncbi:hypothetical protein DB346_15090 [Verrucomicrobia bacterium LW23]|nr:hypothetical protein DB346_15090 [Verrucomicrobia bacterium LW23]